MLPPLATLEDFIDRIPGGIESGDNARAAAVLSDASALIRDAAGKTWEDEAAPDVVTTVCISAAKRAFLNPEGVTSLSLDGHAASFATASADVYLTKAELKAVRRAGGKTGLWTLSTTRAEDDVSDTPSVLEEGILPTEDHVKDIPWGD